VEPRGFTKIRIRGHNLEIEKGRYCKIPRILRLCKTCNKIEDEEHFILECTLNSKLRTDLFAILANENPNLKMKFLIIILLSNKHPYMFVTRKKKPKKNTKKPQCKQDISIYHEQIKRLLSSVLMTLLCRSL
jgi:hypothetical protein